MPWLFGGRVSCLDVDASEEVIGPDLRTARLRLLNGDEANLDTSRRREYHRVRIIEFSPDINLYSHFK